MNLGPGEPAEGGRLATSEQAEGPLLGDATGLRASWQRIQAGFVDDPREAVADAAALVEHTAQALAGALRRRQRGLRAMLDGTGSPGAAETADDGQPTAGGGPDTEQLRLLLRRYRVLFNQICPP